MIAVIVLLQCEALMIFNGSVDPSVANGWHDRQS
jgi:hypothetical protein